MAYGVLSHVPSRRANIFAERLYADLQNNGVRCWFAPEDMKIGDRLRDTIDQQIRLREKLLLVLSAASIASTWVEDEVEAALEEERTSPERRTVLVPITIDYTVEETDRTWVRQIKRTRHIGDFTYWKDDVAYQKALARLLRDLNIVERKLGGQPRQRS
jgi:TIR domain